jgi:hypothetical protein
MRIVIDKITYVELARRACAFTANRESSSITLDRLYKAGHSPMRTQLFWIELWDIPTFVSVHLRTHGPGINPFVKTNRIDRPGHTGDLGRNQPVNHAMLINAEAIINIAHKRLCYQASKETREVVEAIRDKMFDVDPALASRMSPMCVYRNGICRELKPCGRLNEQMEIYNV